MRTKVPRGEGSLNYSRKLLIQNTLSKMYLGILEPHFRYWYSAWGDRGATRPQTLQKLQNQAAGINKRSNFDSPAKPSICYIIDSETATAMYKSLSCLAPEYHSKTFVKDSAWIIRQLRNMETNLLLPMRKTSNGKKGRSFRGSKLWNQLDYDIKQAPSLATFKQRLKGNWSSLLALLWLFINYYY